MDGCIVVVFKEFHALRATLLNSQSRTEKRELPSKEEDVHTRSKTTRTKERHCLLHFWALASV